MWTTLTLPLSRNCFSNFTESVFISQEMLLNSSHFYSKILCLPEKCILSCIIVYCYVQGEFREENFNTAMSVLKDAGDAAKGDTRGKKGGMKRKHRCFMCRI